MTAFEEIEAFRVLIAARLGLSFDEMRSGSLGGILERHAAAQGLAPGGYLQSLREPGSARLLAALAPDLTVGETYFFRDADQLRAFREGALPECTRPGQDLRILSAGCASGEEPYTLAILLREQNRSHAPILGLDVNPAALQKAARRRYSSWSLREMPLEARNAWFRREGSEYLLHPEVGDAVRFAERNLADLAPGALEPESFDVVFCRNVLMYLTPDAARAAVASLERALAPGGALFLGHAENLRGISSAFQLVHTHGAFYYRRLPSEASAARRPSDGDRPAVEGSWVDTIREATERVRSMTEPQPSLPEPSILPLRSDLGPAMDLIERERFADALRCLRALPDTATDDPDVLLLTALVQMHTGELAGAERSCEFLLRVDALSAAAHCVLALCREAAGDVTAAREHDRIASTLDPNFAMPCIHLGLLAGRAGDVDLARSAMQRGLVLLETEHPSRILLFGGGFGRQALMALCRSQLASAGEP